MKWFKNLSLFVVLGFVLTATVSCSASPSSKDELSEQNTVTLYGEVNDSSAYQVIKKIHDLQDVDTDKPIVMFIDSGGGSVLSGLRIIDAMQASKRPVYTVVVGTAASMAAYIHQYGVKRYMLPHAILMFHQARLTIPSDQLEHAENRITMLKMLILDVNLNAAKRTGMPVQELIQREANEYWILADEALTKHFVDGIVAPNKYPVVAVKEETDK
jgi:ATP-dependent Clp protease protease subunit